MYKVGTLQIPSHFLFRRSRAIEERGRAILLSSSSNPSSLLSLGSGLCAALLPAISTSLPSISRGRVLGLALSTIPA